MTRFSIPWSSEQQTAVNTAQTMNTVENKEENNSFSLFQNQIPSTSQEAMMTDV